MMSDHYTIQRPCTSLTTSLGRNAADRAVFPHPTTTYQDPFPSKASGASKVSGVRRRMGCTSFRAVSVGVVRVGVECGDIVSWVKEGRSPSLLHLRGFHWMDGWMDGRGGAFPFPFPFPFGAGAREPRNPLDDGRRRERGEAEQACALN